MIGSIIAQYEILEKVGEGGMGEVFKARDTKLGRFAALKFLTRAVGSTDADRQRFLQEARAAATLNHPNICTVYDVGEHDGKPYIAMEFIEGETLRDRTSGMSVKQSIDVAIQIAEALAAAHEKGIVHRDVKPENVMLRKDGLVQLMDFGLAKMDGVSRLTREGNTVGTMGYMSPEQVQGFAVDHRTDIFSFGVLFYELLSGRSPFKGMHETAIIYEIVNVDPEPVTILKPDLPPDIDAILLECLAKEPDERYQSAREIVKDLRKLKRESSRQTASRILAVRRSQIGPAQPLGPKTAEYETVASAAKPAVNRWIYIAAGATTIAVVLAVVLLFFSTPEQEHLRLTFDVPEGATFNSQNGGHIEISPDGSMIVFAATDTLGVTQLWVRSLSSAVAIPLTGTAGALYPFWSHDSRMIGFFADGKLKKVDAKGGPSFTLCDAPNGRGGTWNKEGTILFSPSSTSELFRVPAAGGVAKSVTVLDSTESETSHRWPSFLPDGEHFLYSCQTNKASLDEESEQIRVGSLSGGSGPIVVRATSNAVADHGFLFYYKQNSLLVQPFDEKNRTLTGDPIPIIEKILYSRVRSRAGFSLSRNGRLVYLNGSFRNSEVVLYSSTGQALSRFPLRSEPTRVSFSRDAKFYAIDAYDEGSKNTDLWVHDIDRHSDARLTFEKSVEIVPEWSPDGKKIFFSSNRPGAFSVYEKNSNGTGDETLLYKATDPTYVTDVSKDSRMLMLSIQSRGKLKWDLGLYDIAARKQTMLLSTEFSEWLGSFSPDAEFFCYQSNETGRNEIYIRPVNNAQSRWQVSVNGGENPRWTTDGRHILYHIANQQMMSAEVSRKGSMIEIGTTTRLFRLEPGFQTTMRDYSRDGKLFLISRSLDSQILKNGSIVMNWLALTERH